MDLGHARRSSLPAGHWDFRRLERPRPPAVSSVSSDHVSETDGWQSARCLAHGDNKAYFEVFSMRTEGGARPREGAAALGGVCEERTRSHLKGHEGGWTPRQTFPVDTLCLKVGLRVLLPVGCE